MSFDTIGLFSAVVATASFAFLNILTKRVKIFLFANSLIDNPVSQHHSHASIQSVIIIGQNIYGNVSTNMALQRRSRVSFFPRKSKWMIFDS